MCRAEIYFFPLVDGVSSFIGELYCLSLGLSDKNPISALHELCTKLCWGKPEFEMHKQVVTLADPKFLMKVLYDFFFYLIIFGFHIHFILISVTFMKLITS